MNAVQKYGSIAFALSLLAACTSTPLTPPAADPAKPAPVVAAVKPVAAVTPPVARAEVPAHLDPASAISRQRSVYFDYDDYSVKKDYAPTLEMHGKYLAAHPALGIKVEGNADERGGAEYNLALGHKRAEAVVRALKQLGVKEQQLEAVSWGKEKPIAIGHDEAAWAQNRRADLSYPAK